MPSANWQKVKEVFCAAMELPAEQQAEFVASQCVEDASIRDEVLRLLQLHSDSSDFLQSPIESAGDPLIGRFAGEFRILQRIGAGGMGAIYEAEQLKPHRRAAVKVLRPGLATPAMLRRFEFEAEILGRLQHPGIAHVYASGTLEILGRVQPWFAMELCDGAPLHKFQRERTMPLAGKLELIARICDAVQHAHQRGVIHRDLKPANILVQADGQPKVLDFGVARCVDEDLHLTMQTSVGQLVGTLHYMSPEQLSGKTGIVDARSDVYALGVIGYEMLAGAPPHAAHGSTLSSVIKSIELHTPARLGLIHPSLRGDAETIIAKAIEKEPDRRYSSASELAADIRRFLNHEPVLARPASKLYQIRKFARRNRALVGGVVATFLALAAGVLTYAIKARQAQREADNARYEADKAVAINNFITNDFLVTLLAASNSRDASLSVGELVDKAAASASTQFVDRPLAEAAVRNEIGTIYYNVGAMEKSGAEFRRALELWERHLGADHADTLKAVHNLGLVARRSGDTEQAEALYRRAIDGRRRTLGAENPFTLVSMNNLAELFLSTGRLAEAEVMFVEVLDTQRRTLGDAHIDTITTKGNLGTALLRLERVDDALAMHQQAFESCRATLGADHRSTLQFANRFGQTLLRARKLDESAKILLETAEAFDRFYPEEHGSRVMNRRALARVLAAQQKPGAQIEQLKIALSIAATQPETSRAADEIRKQLAGATRPSEKN